MYIDADDYIILARTGRHPERHLIEKDYAVGLSDARKIARKLESKYQNCDVEIFLCDGAARIKAT